MCTGRAGGTRYMPLPLDFQELKLKKMGNLPNVNTKI
jgi:hypothetical protein